MNRQNPTVIGKVVVPETYERRNQYETASWWDTVEVPAGTEVEVIFDGYWIIVRGVEGVCTGAHFPSSFGGVKHYSDAGTKRDADKIGKPTRAQGYQTQAWQIKHLAEKGRPFTAFGAEIAFNDAGLALLNGE